jgi:hydrogenase maturation protein HypF
MAATPGNDRLLRVRGTVQGVGFRPFVVRAATRLGLRGWVRNDAQGVLLRAVGEAKSIDRLADELAVCAPAAARVTAVESLAVPAGCDGVDGGFVVLESTGHAERIETSAPADLALCADCRRELADPANRRHGYVFINCTQCGPRYSIIESLPYDRPRTTMRAFRMCPQCQREYVDPGDRRFHAEPNACPSCGPRLALTDANGVILARDGDALRQTAAALRDGRIAAVKGLGGFHLMCDATNEAAVAELRRRKHREEKPLAVMFRDVDAVRQFAEVSPAVATLLESPQSPIVLVPRRAVAPLAPSIAPDNPWVGALIATTPLHVRLMAEVSFPIVATSANLSEEPLCTDDEEARSHLGGIADIFLCHDRPIARPVDDSVIRFTAKGAALVLRRARGYAPSPLTLPGKLPAPVLCVGAHMKNTVAVAFEDRVVLSPHIGDLGGAATRAVFERTIDTLGALFESRPAVVVCDKHPDYVSTRHAEATGLPIVRVQHHLAHVLAVLLEHRRGPDGVLGISWDGTGYGEDGTIWGGEFILLKQGRATRFAQLRPFRLPGGEAAVRDVRRTAVSLVHAVGSEQMMYAARRLGFREAEAALLRAMIERPLNAPRCSSAGRLFDGVGALLGLRQRNAFEGQTPLAVETAAMRARHVIAELPFAIRRATTGVVWEVDWQPAIEALLVQTGTDSADQALAFHRGLVHAMAEVARRAGVPTVALGGGCFQNALLHELATYELDGSDLEVLTPRELPANDGAVAAGQALAALWNLTTVEPATPESQI